jgi:hypothetical protein
MSSRLTPLLDNTETKLCRNSRGVHSAAASAGEGWQPRNLVFSSATGNALVERQPAVAMRSHRSGCGRPCQDARVVAGGGEQGGAVGLGPGPYRPHRVGVAVELPGGLEGVGVP